jgi:hypothetical protein
VPVVRTGTQVSDAAADGRATRLQFQEVGAERYLDEVELR